PVVAADGVAFAGPPLRHPDESWEHQRAAGTVSWAGPAQRMEGDLRSGSRAPETAPAAPGAGLADVSRADGARRGREGQPDRGPSRAAGGLEALLPEGLRG